MGFQLKLINFLFQALSSFLDLNATENVRLRLETSKALIMLFTSLFC